jgi:vacuolar protein sorting-associated protein VTA1
VATKVTAKIFFAASTFYEILEQFGPPDQEVLEKKKYSKWRSVTITNAINAGQAPPPPPGEVEPSATLPSAGASQPGVQAASVGAPIGHANASDRPHQPDAQPPAVQSSAPIISPQKQQPPPVSAPAFPSAHLLPPPPPSQSGGGITGAFASLVGLGSPSAPRPAPASVNDPRVKDAIELSSFAIAALKVSLDALLEMSSSDCPSFDLNSTLFCPSSVP